MKILRPILRLPAVDFGLLVYAAVLTASLVLNVRFALHASAKPPVFAETGFVIGTRLPDVAAGPPGEPTRPLAFARETLLYIFSPSCEWSKGNEANLKAIVEASAKNYDVIGLYAKPRTSDEEAANYLAVHPFPGKVFSVDLSTMKSPSDVARRFGSTPQLLVVSPSGYIRRAWPGALFGERQTEAESYFGVKLPGVKMVGGRARRDPIPLKVFDWTGLLAPGTPSQLRRASSGSPPPVLGDVLVYDVVAQLPNTHTPHTTSREI